MAERDIVGGGGCGQEKHLGDYITVLVIQASLT